MCLKMDLISWTYLLSVFAWNILQIVQLIVLFIWNQGAPRKIKEVIE